MIWDIHASSRVVRKMHTEYGNGKCPPWNVASTAGMNAAKAGRMTLVEAVLTLAEPPFARCRPNMETENELARTRLAGPETWCCTAPHIVQRDARVCLGRCSRSCVESRFARGGSRGRR